MSVHEERKGGRERNRIRRGKEGKRQREMVEGDSKLVEGGSIVT